MTITEKHVNESHIDEIFGLIYSPKNMINLDKEDVKHTLVGKEGVLFQASQEEGEDNTSFMKSFLDELKLKDSLKQCKIMLMSVGMSEEDPLAMDDIDLIHDFLMSSGNETMEVKWGLGNNEANSRMSMLAVCAW